MVANSGELQSVAVHQEVYKEEAAVETIGALEDRYGDRHLDVGQRRQPKKRIRDDSEFRQKIASARGLLTNRVIPESRKGHGRQGPGRENVAKGAAKGRTFERRRRTRQECNTGIKN
jgi:hypothetical protein